MVEFPMIHEPKILLRIFRSILNCAEYFKLIMITNILSSWEEE